MDALSSVLPLPAELPLNRTGFLSWANTLKVDQAPLVYPRNDAELQSLVAFAATHDNVYLRPLGNSHSLAPCVRDTHAPTALMVSLQHYAHATLAALSIDSATSTATVMADTRLYDINRLALQHGLMLSTLSGIGDFTLAGFISNCTHGSFYKNGLFTRCVEALRVVLADGRIEWIDEQSPLFRFVLGGMGYLGIITHARIRLQKATSLAAAVIPFDTPVEGLASWLDQHLLPIFEQQENTGITLIYDASGAGFLATLTPQDTDAKTPDVVAVGQNSFRLWGPRRQALFTIMAKNMRSAMLQRFLRKAFGNFSVFFLKYMTYKAQTQGGYWATTGFFSDASRCLFLGYFIPVSSFREVQAVIGLLHQVMASALIHTELPFEIRFVKACESQHFSPIPAYEPVSNDPFNNLYVAIDIPVNCGGLHLDALDRPGQHRDRHTTRMLDLYWRMEQALKAAFPTATPHWSKFHSVQCDGEHYRAWDHDTVKAQLPPEKRRQFAAVLREQDPRGVFRNEREQGYLRAFMED